MMSLPSSFAVHAKQVCPRLRRKGNYNVVLVVVIAGLLLVYTLTLDETYPYELHSSVLETQQYDREHTSLSQNQTNFCEIINISHPYQADFNCIKTKTTPSATVCLYDEWNDMYISHDLLYTGLWEPQILSEIQESLRRNPHAEFIDVGANIGFYTLIAAKMGHKVVAVEPLSQSIYRLHRAAQIEGTHRRIVVVKNPISDSRLKATIVASGDNQGDTEIRLSAKACSGSCLPTIDTVLLDDLLEAVTFSKAVMKLDIQGFEHRAFQHASHLLSQVYIPDIFMEWFTLKTYHVGKNESSSDHYMVEEMLLLLFERQYRPYRLSSDGGLPLDPSQWQNWPNDIVWRKMLSAEEQKTVLRNHYINWPG